MNGWIIKIIATTCTLLLVILLLGFSYQTTILLEIIGITIILSSCAALYQISQKNSYHLNTKPITKKTVEIFTSQDTSTAHSNIHTETITVSQTSDTPQIVETSIPQIVVNEPVIALPDIAASSSRFKDMFSSYPVFSALLNDDEDPPQISQTYTETVTTITTSEELIKTESENPINKLPQNIETTMQSEPSPQGNLIPTRRKIIKNIEQTSNNIEPSKQFNNNTYNRYEILD